MDEKDFKASNDENKHEQLNADADFHSRKEAAKTDSDLAFELYRSYVGGAETRDERLRRIQIFRCG